MEIILHKNQTETTFKLVQAAVIMTDHLIVYIMKNNYRTALFLGFAYFLYAYTNYELSFFFIF